MSGSYLWSYSDFIGSWSNVCTRKDPSNKVNSVFLFSGGAQPQICAGVFASVLILMSSFQGILISKMFEWQTKES